MLFLLMVFIIIAAFALPHSGGYANRQLSTGTNAHVTTTSAVKATTAPAPRSTAKMASTQGMSTSTLITPAVLHIPAIKSQGLTGTAVTSATTTTDYLVTFNESGLLSGTQWNVSMYNSSGYLVMTNISITNFTYFALTNGIYTFDILPVSGYSLMISNGYIFVNGSNVTQKIVFTPSSIHVHSVTFEAKGFPSSVWNTTLDGVNQSATAFPGYTSYLVPNGTYHFAVSTHTGYTAYPAKGTIQVNGMNLTQQVFYYANSVNVSTVTFTGSNMHSGFMMQVEVVTQTKISFAYSLVYMNTSASNTMLAYLPVGHYITQVMEANVFTNSYGFVVPGPSSNLSVVEYNSYLNITSTAPVNASMTFPTLWKVTFEEANLRNVVSWNVTADSSGLLALHVNQTFIPSPKSYSYFLGSANLSLSQTTLTGYLPNDTYGYTASVSAYNLNRSYNVSGANLTVYIYFPPFYTVTFTEVGLFVAYGWYVTVNGTNMFPNNTGVISFPLPNGTYSFVVAPYPPGDYIESPSSGNFTVDGSNFSQTVVFTPAIPVTFFVTGLTIGTEWSVTLNGTTMSAPFTSIQFNVPAGNYSFSVNTSSGFILSPSNGTVSVVYSPVSVHITNIGYGYPAKFTESGLPSGTAWYVNLSNGDMLHASTPAMTVELLNGSYNYTVVTANPYYSAKSGSFTVDGAAQSVSVAFTAVVYNVTFTETGLPVGTSWSVTLNGNKLSSSLPNISFEVSKGTYAFTVSNESGYNVTPASGSLTVGGSALSETVAFSKQPSTVGLSSTDFEIFGGVVVVAVIAGAAGVMLARRKRRL